MNPQIPSSHHLTHSCLGFLIICGIVKCDLLSKRHLSPIFEEPMRKFSLLILFLVVAMGSVKAQVLSVTPVFPKENDTITIVYNAKLGNAALVGVSQVYAHTGVITNLSTSGSDWKHVVGTWGTADNRTKMTYMGTDLWKIKYHVKDFYSQGGAFSGSEVIYQLAFVFRNADGTKVGRSAAGTDIFTPIYSTGLAAKFTLPETRDNIISGSSTQKIEVWSSRICDIALILNGDTLRKSSSQDSFQASLSNWKVGKNVLVFSANYSTFKAYDTIVFTVNPTVVQASLPANMKQGVNYLDDSTVLLALFAPYKNYVYVIGDFNKWGTDTAYFMNFSSTDNIWWKRIGGLKKGVEYGFQYWVDGKVRVADPFAELLLSEWDDSYIPAANYPKLKLYPKNKTQGWVGVLQTAQTPYAWSKINFQRPDKDRLVIYECLTRDFTKAQTFKAIQDTLQYLKRLGITALQLMPVCEFEGNLSWGYNPASHMAIDKYYGTRDAFKSLIDACHQNGIAVILDVVYNHAFGSAAVTNLYWDGATGKPAGNSPYLNVDAKHPFNVGYDFNHESAATKYYTKRTLTYLLEEFRVDGFRFDLSKGMTQTNSGTDAGKMSAYDQSRIDILSDYNNTVQAISPGAYTILEHFADNSEEQVLQAKGMMLWGNGNYNVNEAVMGFTNNDFGYGIDAQKRGWSNRHLIGYAVSHDEERMAYKSKAFGNVVAGHNVKTPAIYIPRVAMAYGFVMATPGPKMIWQFDELAYDYSINTCEDGVTIQDGCRLSNKPVRWDYWTADATRRKTYYKIAAINHLKLNELGFYKPTSYVFSSGGSFKKLNLNHVDLNTVVIGNFDVSSSSSSVTFPHTGTWYDYMTGDSLVVSTSSLAITLAAGDWKVYLDKNIKNPYINQWKALASVTGQVKMGHCTLVPNPAKGGFAIVANGIELGQGSVQVIDMAGRVGYLGHLIVGERVNIDQLQAGHYVVVVESAVGNYRSHLVVE